MSEEETEKLVADLKAKLAARKGRVLDMFRLWDADQDGQVSAHEFQKAVKRLNLGFSEDVVQALFNSLDDDGSGQLDFEEISSVLHDTKPRRETHDRLKASKAKLAKLHQIHAKSLEDAEKNRRGRGTEAENLVADLSAKLAARRVKILDMIKTWDADGNGQVSQDEFRKAIKRMSLAFSDEVIEALFNSLDEEGTGEIAITALEQALKKVKPRRNTAVRLKISQAKAAAMAPPTSKKGFESTVFIRSFNRGKSAFGTSAKRDKYTGWVAARAGIGCTPRQVGPGKYPND